MKPVVSSVLVAVMSLAALPALAQNGADTTPPAPAQGFGPGYGPMWGYGHHHFWGWGWGFHPFGAIFSILVILFFIAVILRMFGIGRYGRMHYRYGYGRGGTALDILEERFARGEIDKNEFEEKRKLLTR